MTNTDSATLSGSESSPFWKSRPAVSRSSSGRPSSNASNGSSIVVGASYSHADMLKFDDLSLAPSRSRTPQSSNRKDSSRTAALKDAASRNGSSSSLRRTFSNEDTPSSPTVQVDDDDGTAGSTDSIDWGFDQEDEFGLPSLTAGRHSKKSPSGRGTRIQPPTAFGYYPSSRPGASRRSESVDIGDNRGGGPHYPMVGNKMGEKILRPQHKEVLRDPANSLHLIEHAAIPSGATAKEKEAHSTRNTRLDKFKRILQASSVNLSELRSAAWSGIPHEVRSMAWMLLLGYLPTSAERRVAALEKKRKDYLEGIKQVFKEPGERPSSARLSQGRSGQLSTPGRSRGLDETVWHQISIDVPRTSPHLPLYGFEATQRSLERILYLWAMRHPASGYVQGINDLVTPFWQVFLGSYITDYNIEAGMDPGQLPRPVLDAVEADTYWCLTKLLDGIQDNYIHAQPGIVRQVNELQDLIARIDLPLSQHFANEGVEFMQFSFRWMNCLLMREVDVKCTIRMWDTYMAEEDGFSKFHLYVCAAFLVKWTTQLAQMDFQEIITFLQATPTKQWDEKDIELLLSEAFIWQQLFRGSAAHLKNSKVEERTTG